MVLSLNKSVLLRMYVCDFILVDVQRRLDCVCVCGMKGFDVYIVKWRDRITQLYVAMHWGFRLFVQRLPKPFLLSSLYGESVYIPLHFSIRLFHPFYIRVMTKYYICVCVASGQSLNSFRVHFCPNLTIHQKHRTVDEQIVIRAKINQLFQPFLFP